ncbi:hypothetical protein OC834_002403 [Tilletia horrida]|nr:hypothetical protein OC834_002403 [Tilletia horrida]KAK0561771.1 hypothetical protein OC844_003043 [Tilletia horrida]
MKQAAFAIEPLTEAVVDETALIFALAMAEGIKPIFPHGANDEMIAFRKSRHLRSIARAQTERPSRLFPTPRDAQGTMRGKIRAVVARERGVGDAGRRHGRVAGFYLFELYEDGKGAEFGEVPDKGPMPTGGDEGQVETFFEWMGDAQRKHMGSQTYAHLTVACVHPDFRGTGAHAALASYFSLVVLHEWGAPPAYLEALTGAAPVWKHLGFDLLESYDITALNAVRGEEGLDEFGLAGSVAKTKAEQKAKAEADGGQKDDRAHYWMHTMLRSQDSSAAVFERTGGMRAALAALLPASDQDRNFGGTSVPATTAQRGG